MYRKPRRGAHSGVLDLDSLMDILSCLVGVMLFMVIYTVLELGSTTFEVSMPAARAAPAGSREVMVLATNGTVRVLDTREPLRRLLSGVAVVSRDEALEFVAQANAQPPVDEHFRYTLEYRDRLGTLGALSGTVDLRISARPGVSGDSVQHLDDGSAFSAALGRLDPENEWLQFAVDGSTLEAFRRAREMADDRGFATGWTPFDAELPLIYPLSAGGNRGANPRGAAAKPQR